MLTYQIRPRVLRIGPDQNIAFPANCEICFHFQPAQPFGVEPGGGRTTVQSVAGQVFFNANSGKHSVVSNEPLLPLDVTLESPTSSVILNGTTLKIKQRIDSINQMNDVINDVFFVFPSILNIHFADPPFIERVDGKVGDVNFRWELASWDAQFRITTQNHQEENFAKAWSTMGILDVSKRRVVASLHYFHVACRLACVTATAGEFLAEVILNLSKTLEVLFPPCGDGQTRNAVRIGLSKLNYADHEIERNFLPVMALRNEIDVGHVELGLFTLDHLKTIHGFTERVEGVFRDMFNRLLTCVESGEIEIAPYELSSASRKAIKVIERMKCSMAQPSSQSSG